MDGKKKYQKPVILNLSNQTVYGGFDSPTGMCNTGGTVTPALGCTVGSIHGVEDVCGGGGYPNEVSCNNGSFVGNSWWCGNGGNYGQTNP